MYLKKGTFLCGVKESGEVKEQREREREREQNKSSNGVVNK